MGKNGKFGKDYGKVVGKDSESRPGWKGPGYIKKQEPKPKPKPPPDASEDTEPAAPLELQQLLLNIFKDTFSELLTSEALQSTSSAMQEVKGALYDRDFQRAFSKEEYLKAYAARWSPSRALCFLSIFIDLREHLQELIVAGRIHSGVKAYSQALNVSSFGGGAAEVVAFGGLVRYLTDVGDESPSADGGAPKASGVPSRSYFDIKLSLTDRAAWKEVVDTLHRGFITPPRLSKYASASVAAANSSLIPANRLVCSFRQLDALSMAEEELAELSNGRTMLITFLFTLNELYTESRAKTTQLLFNLTTSLKTGSLLLVVDSPGSYSETTIGTEAKKYPMKWLLDHTLLKSHTSKGGEDSDPLWVKVVYDDSRWFRLPETLHYPIPLENMRTQVHLYRRA